MRPNNCQINCVQGNQNWCLYILRGTKSNWAVLQLFIPLTYRLNVHKQQIDFCKNLKISQNLFKISTMVRQKSLKSIATLLVLTIIGILTLLLYIICYLSFASEALVLYAIYVFMFTILPHILNNLFRKMMKSL